VDRAVVAAATSMLKLGGEAALISIAPAAAGPIHLAESAMLDPPAPGTIL